MPCLEDGPSCTKMLHPAELKCQFPEETKIYIYIIKYIYACIWLYSIFMYMESCLKPSD